MSQQAAPVKQKEPCKTLTQPLSIAIIGPGRIGSLFAYLLGKAGHTITLVGRPGKRLSQVQREGAVTVTQGNPQRVAVTATEQLHAHIPYDLVLVTLYADQLQPLLPTLRQSSAAHVVCMFNTFQPSHLAADIRSHNNKLCNFALPQFSVDFTDGGKLNRSSISRWEPTAASHPMLAEVFAHAGIPTVVYADMESWLKSHAALAAPVLAMGPVVALQGGKGLSWAQASQHAHAVAEGFSVVSSSGHPIIPGFVRAMSRLPSVVISVLLWSLSRTAFIRAAGFLVAGEAGVIMDQMIDAAGSRVSVSALRVIRQSILKRD